MQGLSLHIHTRPPRQVIVTGCPDSTGAELGSGGDEAGCNMLQLLSPPNCPILLSLMLASCSVLALPTAACDVNCESCELGMCGQVNYCLASNHQTETHSVQAGKQLLWLSKFQPVYWPFWMPSRFDVFHRAGVLQGWTASGARWRSAPAWLDRSHCSAGMWMPFTAQRCALVAQTCCTRVPLSGWQLQRDRCNKHKLDQHGVTGQAAN